MAELGSDYTFEVTYDIFPTFTIDDYHNIEVEKDEVKISNDDIDKEIENLIKQQSTVEPKDGKIENGDIAVIDLTIFAENTEFDKKENEYVYVGKKLNIYKIDDDIIGLKKGEVKEFEKTFPDDEIDNLKGKTFLIKIKINEVKIEKIPELNDDLAKQINEKCTTVKEFKEKIKEDIEKYSEEVLNNKIIEEAYKKIIETFKGPVPDSMIEKQQDMIYQNLLYQIGGNEQRLLSMLKQQNLTKETYLDKMKENAEYNIKKGLILDKIVKSENLGATEEEVIKFIEPLAEKYKMKTDELVKMYKDAGNFDMLKNDVETKKAVDFLRNSLKIKKGKKLNYSELLNSNISPQ
jgi:trigger factor